MNYGHRAQVGAGGREVSAEVDRELYCRAECPDIPQI